MQKTPDTTAPQDAPQDNTDQKKPKETGGRSAEKPDATRYGVWETNGRCVDF